MAQPISQTWRDNLGKSARQIVRVEAYTKAGQIIWSTDPAGSDPLEITAASVSVDMTRGIRSTGEIEMQTDDDASIDKLVPSTVTAPLSPLAGTQFQLYAGFEWPGDVTELVPVGRMYCHDSDVDETASGITVALSLQDLSGRLDVADITDPVTIARGTNYVAAVQFLIAPVLPGLTYVADHCPHTTPPLTFDPESNRLDEIAKMLRDVGMEMFFDPLGRCRIRDIPETTDDPTWYFVGADVTPLTGVRNRLSDERVYNGVMVRGENLREDTAPVEAVAWDTDPMSPTYYDPTKPSLSTVGPRPFFYASEYITTQAQADAAAAGMKRSKIGLLQRVQIVCQVNPAINVGDVIEVDRPRTGVAGRYIVESFGFDMTTDDMVLTCQERRL